MRRRSARRRTERRDSAPPVHFVPVTATIPAGADTDDDEFRQHAYELGLDCVNQGGAAQTSIIAPPA